MALYIVLAGTTGVGKSTLTAKLAKRFQFHPFYEELDDNPYLEPYYQGQGQEVCFEMQTYFLGQRIAQQTEVEAIVKSGQSVIHDRSIYEDLHIFSTHQYKLGLMTERQFDNYRRLFNAMVQHLHPPDLIIYLHATTERLLSQIVERGRSYEQQIDTQYLGEINERYEHWLQLLEQGEAEAVPLMPVDVCQTDLRNESEFNRFCDDFSRKLAEITLKSYNLESIYQNLKF